MTIDGRRLSYLDRAPAGARRTVVFLHAFPLNADMWAPQFAAVSGDWRLVAPDFRGFGDSDADPAVSVEAGLSLDDYAADVMALLRHLGVDDAVVAGLSLGGYVLFALLRGLDGALPTSHPLRLRGLVLADTRYQADTEEGRAGRLRMAELVGREGAAGAAKAMLPKLLGEETRRARPDAVDAVRRLILRASPEAIAAASYRMMTRPDSAAELARIACPTLVLVGEHDELTPPEVSRDMHERIAGATLEVVPGAGHMTNLERPDVFNRALVRFLDRI